MNIQQRTSNFFPVIEKNVCARRDKLYGDIGYCKVKRVQNQLCYEAAEDLRACRVGQQCPPHDGMKAADNMFTGDDEDGVPPARNRAGSLHLLLDVVALACWL